MKRYTNPTLCSVDLGYTHCVADVLIALGSNMGDSLANLQEATLLLERCFDVVARSHVYKTAPMYVVDQPTFLNAAILARTSIGPKSVLRRLKELELQIGREERQHFGLREIDLDLIAYGTISYRYTEGKRLVLEVPHPRVVERRFVLQPVADVAPDFNLPGIGIVSELLKQTEHQADSVEKVDHALLSIQRPQ